MLLRVCCCVHATDTEISVHRGTRSKDAKGIVFLFAGSVGIVEGSGAQKELEMMPG